ncbi:hypothetical protein DFH07DRAFT_262372 [Mycena maculata]|uniref:Uncharacterized protein n=1 Tax=Mycena maculata TaxID=230809 RepID=A0AAD7HNG6_9AGAR|nr:hypothetical protein DFH07DRAFT_262372 [Mycena maculata]
MAGTAMNPARYSTRLFAPVYTSFMMIWSLGLPRRTTSSVACRSCQSRTILVDTIYFSLNIPSPTQNPPVGYLFTCPGRDFRTGLTSFRWPNCPTYWSLDPSGAERLSIEEARHLGFPNVQFTTEITGHSWDASVYKGLHQFHTGKKFDADSQNVVRHLGLPLYQVPSAMVPPFAHVDGEVLDTEAENESDHLVGTCDDVVDVSAAAVQNEQDSQAITDSEDLSQPLQKYAPAHTSETEQATPKFTVLASSNLPSSWSWKVVELMKLALILVLVFVSLHNYFLV